MGGDVNGLKVGEVVTIDGAKVGIFDTVGEGVGGDTKIV